MKITDIENMTADELKAVKNEAVEAVKGDPQLVERYVQARLDATTRDEKLAEQGRTITELHDSLAAERAATERAAISIKQSATAIVVLKGREKTIIGETETLRAELNTMSGEVAGAASLAKARRAGLAEVAAIINPLLAAE